LVTSVDPYTGSGATSRFAMWPFLGIILKILGACGAQLTALVRIQDTAPEP